MQMMISQKDMVGAVSILAFIWYKSNEVEYLDTSINHFQPETLHH